MFTFTLENLSAYTVLSSIVFPEELKSVVEISDPVFATDGFGGGNIFALPKATNETTGTPVTLSISLKPKTNAGFDAIDLSGMKISFEKAVEESVTATATANTYVSDKLSFTVNTTTKTARVSAKDESISGNIVIPEVVTYGDNSYVVTTIGSFLYCSDLTSVTISKIITSLDATIFAECSSLTNATIPSSVTRMGPGVFDGTPFLTNLKSESQGIYTCSDGKKIMIEASSEITSAADLTGVYLIAEYAFAYCSSLTSITIPSSVTSIARHVFSSCSSLTSITIPEGVTYIGFSSFDGCSSLTSIIIPSSVNEIQPCAFGGCNKLTRVTFEDTTSKWTITDMLLEIPSEDINATLNPSTNATYLTSTYRNCTWTKNS